MTQALTWRTSDIGIFEGATWTWEETNISRHDRTVTARATRTNMREAHDAALDGARQSKRRRGDDDPSASEIPDFTHVLVRANSRSVPFFPVAL